MLVKQIFPINFSIYYLFKGDLTKQLYKKNVIKYIKTFYSSNYKFIKTLLFYITGLYDTGNKFDRFLRVFRI